MNSRGKRKNFKILIKTISTLLLIVVTLIHIPVKAFATTPATPSANEMTNSMLTFFREDRTGLNADRVARDEIMTYGVFLSNFFVPGKTKLKDMIDDTTDASIPKLVSTKFFGSAGKAGDVKNLNNKLYTAISSVLQTDAASFALYATPADVASNKIMSGEDLYKLMGGTGVRKIYNGSQITMDLSDNATRGAWQILFGFSPELILDKDKGLRSLTKLYIDGLGNIWAAYNLNDRPVGIDDYVLVFPSCLNPVVFSNSTTGAKLPLANAFAMGGVLKITEDFLASASPLTPYYNIKKYFTTGSSASAKSNGDNMLTMFGVQSPVGFMGKSDSIIMNGATTNPIGDVLTYLNGTTSDSFDDSKATIVLAMDLNKMTDIEDYFKKATLDDAGKYALFNYFTASSTFAVKDLADDMYYFSGVKGANGDQGDWQKNESLIKGQKLFAKEANGQYTFYAGSHFSSSFNRFLVNFNKVGNEDTALLNIIKAVTPNSKVETSDKGFINLKSFFKTGTFVNKDASSIMDAFDLITPPGKDYVYDILPPSGLTNEAIMKDAFWGNKVSHKAFALTEDDTILSRMSYAALKGSWLDDYKIGTYAPFSPGTKGGGLIDDLPGDRGGSSMTENGINSIATYFHNALTYRIFSMSSTFTKNLSSTMTAGTKYKGVGDKEYTIKTAVMNDVNNWPGIYWGYMVNFLGIENREGKLTNTKSFSNKCLPEMTISTLGGSFDLGSDLEGSGAVSSEDKTMEEMQKDILKKVYGLLSDGPNNYRDKLMKATQDSWVLSTHRAITGSWLGNVLSVSAGGGGTYASVVGYINTPNLNELPITSWILKDYMYIYVFLLLIMLGTLILLVLTNIRSVREGILIFILMCFVLMLPQYLLNNIINISNSFGNKIYSQRFNYWAITQHQQASTTLASATNSMDTLDATIAKSMQDAKNVHSSDAGVRIKWMAPKKDDQFSKLFNASSTSQSLTSNLTIFRWLFNSVLNQEEYVYINSLTTYLYRPYNDIASTAKSSYAELSAVNLGRDAAVKSVMDWKNKDLNLPIYRFMKLVEPAKSKVSYAASQKTTIDLVKAYTTEPTNIAKIEDYRYWIMGNAGISKSIFRSNYESTAEAGISGSTDDKYANAYLLATESPFYYFYNVLNSRYKSVNGGFKNALLAKEVFTVKSPDASINNAMRDFLDLEGLFTYVIPYLNEGNQYVYGWTNKYGKSVDGFDFAGDTIGVNTQDSTLSAKYTDAQNKKEQLQNIWKMYTPWVDQMYSLGVYGKKVKIANKTVYVDDTINPGAYEVKGRPMIFSEADMYAKNYRVKDLSDVERRIQETLDTTYTDMLYLTNYYDFSDDVLLTAAAMMATFNFDREFSQSKFIGETVTIYPQSFELKNFNYDAFMRLALLNATGEPLMADQDLYTRILSKTSIFTGIIMLIKDLLGVFVIPGAKVVILLLMLILGLLISVSCVISLPNKLAKLLWKHLGVPAVIFLVSNIAFAFVISMFMGEGLTSYVGSRTPSAGMTDPTIVLLLMIITDCVYLFVMMKVLGMLTAAYKNFGISSFFGAVNIVAGAATSAMGSIKNTVGNALNRQAYRNDYNKMIGTVKGSGGNSGGGYGGSSSQDSSDGSGGSEYIKDKNNKNETSADESTSKDKNFKADLEEKSKNRREDVKGGNADLPEKSARKKTIGERLVDISYAPGNGVKNVTKPIRKAVYSAKIATGDYKNKMQEYEYGKVQDRIDSGVAGKKDYEKKQKLNNDVENRDKQLDKLKNTRAIINNNTSSKK